LRAPGDAATREGTTSHTGEDQRAHKNQLKEKWAAGATSTDLCIDVFSASGFGQWRDLTLINEGKIEG